MKITRMYVFIFGTDKSVTQQTNSSPFAQQNIARNVKVSENAQQVWVDLQRIFDNANGVHNALKIWIKIQKICYSTLKNTNGLRLS